MLQAVSRARARRDPAYFAEKLLGYQIHRYQAAVIDDKHSTTVWVAGRGAGKTYTAMTYALWRCYTNRDYVVVYIAARMGQAKIAWDVAMSMLEGTPLREDVVELSRDRIRLRNGSAINFIPGGNPVAARGFHNKYVREGAQPGVTVIIDEAASVSRDTYTAAVSIINTAPDERRKMLIVGSPMGTNHWFCREYVAGMDRSERFTKAFQTPSTACPHVSSEFIEEYRSKLSPVEFNAEILAQFQEALDAFFGGYIDGAVKPYRLPLPYNPQCSYHLGVDLSTSARYGSDFTVLVVTERWFGGRLLCLEDLSNGMVRTVERNVAPYVRVADIRRYQFLDHERLRQEIVDVKERYQLHKLTTETYESTQLEAICRGNAYMQVQRLSPTNQLQRETFPYLHALLRDGTLQLPSDGPNAQQLLHEMKAFTYRITDAGNITYAGADGEKDDTVYALNWSIHGLPRYESPPARIF